MPFVKDRSAGYLANHMARLFARELHRRIKPLGLTPGTFPALLALWEREGLTQRELTDRLDIEQATMANTLGRMERDGLIVRRRDTRDGRVQRIWLTEKARSLEAQAVAAADQVNAEALDGLSEADRARFVALMGAVIRGLQTRPPGDVRE